MTIRCVLMDIEGTILPISFVREVLFPYAEHRMDAFLRTHRQDPAVQHWAAECQDTMAQETGVRPTIDDLPGILRSWIIQDRKHVGLKSLQGMIWEEGYQSGSFTPALYEDVFSALLSWKASGLELALYSSGSEQAQRLLVSHTTKGDLTSLFTQFFDTRVGPKADAASYRHIADALNHAPEQIRFLSDVEAELDAAAAAGLLTTHIVRPGTEAGRYHPIASDFRELTLSGFVRPAPYPVQP